ncbi:MAG TPA: hypothetical protein VGL58_21210 [Caulobacteraceae bacterium]|jgi:hypothetical protein
MRALLAAAILSLASPALAQIDPDAPIATAPPPLKPAAPTPQPATPPPAAPATSANAPQPAQAPVTTLQGPPSAAEAHWEDLLAQAQANAPNVDWQALRVAYAERPGFVADRPNVEKEAMFKAIEIGDCARATEQAKGVIAEAYVDADAHLIAAYCDEKAGDAKAATLERDIGLGLLTSIQTGDGKSTASPFTPIDVDEEYALIRARGLRVTSQSLLQENGHSYDALATVDDKGHAQTYYFLIDAVLALEAAALKPGDVSEGGPPK